MLKPFKRQSQLQQTTNFATSLLIFERNREWYFMIIIRQQTILMKYHALFVIFEKAAKIWNCRLLQIIVGALRVNPFQSDVFSEHDTCMLIEQSRPDFSGDCT